MTEHRTSPIIRPERPDDAPRVRSALEAAFSGTVEADVVEKLRAAGDIVLALIAEQSGVVAGYVAFPRLNLDLGGRTVPVMGLAPAGVIPPRQRQGVGSLLIRDGIARLKDRGERLLFVLGDPAYYGRFGFKARGGFVSRWAGPHFQALMLTPDAPVAGRVSYPQPFADLG